jgi:hypothetical protein
VPSLEFPVCIYSAFGLLYAWSCFATWFVLPNWIGIAICSVAIVAAYAFTFVVHYQMAAQFSAAVAQVRDFLRSEKNDQSIIAISLAGLSYDTIWSKDKVNHRHQPSLWQFTALPPIVFSCPLV